MEEKFNEKFAAFIESNKRIFIPSADKYEQLLSKLQKWVEKKLEKPTTDDLNLIRNYSVRIENNTPYLYHQGIGGKKEAQRVVKREELFQLLQSTHEKIGHGGINLMWKELRNFYGISK